MDADPDRQGHVKKYRQLVDVAGQQLYGGASTYFGAEVGDKVGRDAREYYKNLRIRLDGQTKD